MAHKVSEFYKKIYSLSGKINKRDKFGIWLKIENSCLETLRLVIKASFTNKLTKLPLLDLARTEIEVLKRFITIAHELKIIQTQNYLGLESDLQEISKMANGWIRYLTQKER
ncbi:MAG: four helix bundle protein [Parcubacteria group bacterium]|nr:four helix bundle protein [Parcubacteria group bacterium]